MLSGDSALAARIELCRPDGRVSVCQWPLWRRSISGTPRPAKFEPPKNQPVRPSATTLVNSLRLVSGGNHLVASLSSHVFCDGTEAAARGMAVSPAARTAAAQPAAIAFEAIGRRPIADRCSANEPGRIGASVGMSGKSGYGVGPYGAKDRTRIARLRKIPDDQLVIAIRQRAGRATWHAKYTRLSPASAVVSDDCVRSAPDDIARIGHKPARCQGAQLGAATGAGGRDPGLPDRGRVAQRRPPGSEPRRGGADNRAGPGLRLALRPDRLGHRASVLCAQAAHWTDGWLRGAAAARRRLWVPEPGRVRARLRPELPP